MPIENSVHFKLGTHAAQCKTFHIELAIVVWTEVNRMKVLWTPLQLSSC